MAERARTITRFAVLGGGMTLLLFGLALRNQAVEQWYIWRLDSGDADVRLSAVEHLSRAGTERALLALFARLDESLVTEADAGRDTNPEIELFIEGILRCGPAAVPHFEERLRSARVGIRVAAARSLIQLGPEAAPAVPALIHSIDDSDAVVRLLAVVALGRVGHGAESALPALRRLERNAGIEPAVREAIERIEGDFD